MQPFHGGIAGNDDIRVVAEPLQAAIPNISMNIVVVARWQPKKLDVPHGSQDEPNDHNASGNAPFKFWRGEQLTDRQEVRDSRKRQRGDEVRSASIAEVA